MFYHSITKFVFIFQSLPASSGKRSAIFSLENAVPITHEQDTICSKTRLDGTTHEQTIICRELFAGHVVGSRSMERKKKKHGIIIYHVLEVFLENTTAPTKTPSDDRC